MNTTALIAQADQIEAELRTSRHCDVFTPCEDCEDKRAELATLRARISVARAA